MTKEDERFYEGFNQDLPMIELHFGEETAYFPQTPQLNIIGAGNLKDNVRYAISKEYIKKELPEEEVDAYIEQFIKEKGLERLYWCLFYSANISQDILEYCDYIITPYEAEEYKGEIGEEIEPEYLQSPEL